MKDLAMLLGALLCAASMLFAGFFTFAALATGNARTLIAAIACIFATVGSVVVVVLSSQLSE